MELKFIDSIPIQTNKMYLQKKTICSYKFPLLIHSLLRMHVLCIPQSRIKAALLQQLLMCASIDNTTTVEHQNFVGIHHG